MLVLISPTKNLKPVVSDLPLSIPVYAKHSELILKELKKYDVETLKDLLNVKENMAAINLERYREIDFDDMGTAAFLTYSGIQFKYMNHRDLNDDDLNFANEHIRILSGFYGIVRPFDSIYPYRLEMQCKLNINDNLDLYTFWNDKLMSEIRNVVKTQKDSVILDLCSQEYTKAFYPYANENDQYVRVTFRILKNGKLKTEATQAKMARGRMVHDIIKQRMDCVEDVKGFQSDGYQYIEEYSSKNELVFLKSC